MTPISLLRSIVTTLVLSPLNVFRVYAAGPVPFEDNTDLGTYYPYAVHKPVGDNPPERPPLNLFLHGMGSRGDVGEMETLVTWNGPGRRLLEYHNGNVTDSSRIVAEQFLTVMPLAPNTTEDVPEWHLDGVMAVLGAVQEKYSYDPERVYLSGYSMGSRDGWKLLMTNPGSFAAAALSAGEPDTSSNFSALANIPLQHYAGTADYDGSSSVAVANKTQGLLKQAGCVHSELVILQGPEPSPAHYRMANVPFFEPYFSWMLSNKASLSAAVRPSSSAAAPSATETSENSGVAPNVSPPSVVIGFGGVLAAATLFGFSYMFTTFQ